MKKPVVNYKEFRLRKLNDPQFSHLKLLLGWVGYFLLYFITENLIPVERCYPVHSALDDIIPFCEYFVIPYLLWFAYVAGTVVYFMIKNKQDYYKLCTFLYTGMTIFLIISTLWPNGHHLRPHILENENIFTRLVHGLYQADTPTNLWPSIHVYNSIGVHLAVVHSHKLHKNKVVHIGSLLLCISIIMSTVFLKQHSLFDVITGFIMAAVMYLVVYAYDIVTIFQMRRYLSRRRRVHHV